MKGYIRLCVSQLKHDLTKTFSQIVLSYICYIVTQERVLEKAFLSKRLQDRHNICSVCK